MKTASTASRPRTRLSKAGKSPLVRSSSSARREKAVLRRSRERIRDQAENDQNVARTTLAARRTGKA